MTELPASIQNLDLSLESARFIKDGGYTLDQARETEPLYRKFLALCIIAKRGVTPSEIVDDFWHAHLADTRKYMADCEAICGRFIHHDPKIQGAVMEEQFAYTNALSLEIFGTDMRGQSAACGMAPAQCGNAPAACGNAPAACGSAPAGCGNAPAGCGA